jgi:GAF domain-containing protein
MLGHGHKFEVGSQSMVGWVCANRKARIALDVGQDAVRFANPLLPDTRSEIALPLQAGGRILGVLDVQSERPAAFDHNDIAVLQGMADQIAVALDNARLFTQTQTALSENERLLSQVETALHEATALYEASQAISAASDNSAVFQAIVDHVLKPDIDLCLLVLFEAYESGLPQALDISQVWARAGQLGRQEAETLVGSHFVVAQFPLREFLHADRPQVIRSRTHLPINVAAQKLWERLGVQALALIPLNAGGRRVGVLCLGAAGEAAFAPGILRSYQAAANQVAITVENRRLYEDTQTSLREVSALYRSFTREAWERTLQARPTLSEYDYVAVPGTRVESHDGDGSGMRVPLRLRDQDIGYLELAGSEQTWTEQTRTLVETVSAQVALALESARLFDQTQRLAGRERLVNEITSRIRASSTVPGILQTAARELAAALNVPHAVARIELKRESPAVTEETA